MEITAGMVKELRDATGAGMMDCKKVLVEANGDMKKATELLREKGKATAAKKSGRITSEGIVASYIHGGGTIGVLIEVNCETDFTARNNVFQDLVKDIAMQIAASKPIYISRNDVPGSEIETERRILKAQAVNEGKPENIAEKMVEGRIGKFYKEMCLLEQPFIRNPDITVQQLIEEKINMIRENISVRRFTRYVMGEGLEKKECDFPPMDESQVK
jgi:elongation factor Ts